MTESSSIRLLLGDDHPVVRSGLKAILCSQPNFEVIGEAANGVRAVELVDRLRPDVVLMDLQMPEMDGVAAIEKIKPMHPEIQILELTTYETDADIMRAVEKGANGFLLKDAPKQDLFDAIRHVAQGKAPLSPTVAARIMQRMRGSAEQNLSEREIEILQLVALGKTNREVGQKLYIAVDTVKTHLEHIYQKLGTNDRTAAGAEALRRRLID